MSTFHSTCARILRQEIEALGFTRRFAIYDDDDQLRLLKGLVLAAGYDPHQVEPRVLMSRIDHYKNRMSTPDEIVKELRSSVGDPVVRIWRDYEDALRAADALDFNDLVSKTVELFGTRPDVLAKWRQRFRYVMVDEYQDTNRAQYLLLRQLADEHRNLAVVGDDDQSIYGFRGADVANLLGFQQDFPEAKVVRLEQNYRSTANILAARERRRRPQHRPPRQRLWTAGPARHEGPARGLVRARAKRPRGSPRWCRRSSRSDPATTTWRSCTARTPSRGSSRRRCARCDPAPRRGRAASSTNAARSATCSPTCG